MASQQCWGVTAGQARHNSSNVGGVTAGQVDTTLVLVIIVDKMLFIECYLLLSREDNTMRLSSSIVTISSNSEVN